MANQTIEQLSEVAVGMTDGFRYIGIKPPLTEAEAEALGVKLTPYNQITEPGPAATLLSANGELFEGGPNARTNDALRRAREIGKHLSSLRGHPVLVHDQVMGLMGHNSTPFNPYTD